VAQKLQIEYRWAGDRSDQQELAAELVRRRVAVLATMSNIQTVAAKAATTTIPIVFSIGGDPVKLGLVASLNRPGGNITGITFLSAGTVTKRLQFLHELAPGVITALMNPINPSSEAEFSDTLEAARALGLQLHMLKASSERELDTAFATLAQQQARALLIQGDPFFYVRRRQIAAFALRHGIPAMAQDRGNAEAGILLSYGTNIAASVRLAGAYVGRILRGEKPADLPVQQTTRFELVINLATAKALGITIPPTLLALADEVIE
jgi:ABC-type uncharacterized transport system substrate-binding protein